MEKHAEQSVSIPRSTAPAAIFGTAAVVAGGLLAAVTASSTSQPTAWASAYLVLVVGVVQVALAVGLGLLAVRPISAWMLWLTFGMFNLGNAGVLAGTLLDTTVGGSAWMVRAGGTLLVAAMTLLLHLVRGARWGVLRWLYVGVVTVILVSIPIGLVLASI